MNPRFTDFLEANLSSQVPFESFKLHFMTATSGACISFIQSFFSIKFVGLCSPWSVVIVVKFSFESKLFWMFGSNSNYKIPTFFNLQWTLAACCFFIQCPFPIKVFGEVAHTSLVCVVKISEQSKKLWVTERHFSKRKFNYRWVFCNFWTF